MSLAALVVVACTDPGVDASAAQDAGGTADALDGSTGGDGSTASTASGVADDTAEASSGSSAAGEGSTGDPATPCEQPWVFEVVEEWAGVDSDVEVGPSGALHVFYLGGTFPQSQAIRHAVREAGQWIVTEIADTLESFLPGSQPIYRAGVMLDGVVGSDGTLHVGFRMSGAYPTHARNAGDGWVVERMYAAGVSAAYLNPAIEVRSDGVVEMVYQSTYGYAGFEDGLMHADQDGGKWVQAPIVPDSGRGHAAFAWTEAGRHVAFLGGLQGAGPPMYAGDASGTWSIEPIDPAIGWGLAVEVEVASDGEPRVAFHGGGDDLPEGIYLATRDAGAWTVELVAEAPIDAVAVTQRIGLAVDGDDTEHLAFAGPDTVMYARRDGATWHTEEVGAHWGDHPSLALGPSGPVVAFRTLEQVPRLLVATRSCEL